MGEYKIIEASSGDKHCDYNDYIKRARYFHGMLMTDRDFKEEQLYHNKKRKLLNQMLHGWGVVCGLKVKPTDPAGPNIIVEPGLALDCNGNEILVCDEQTIDLSANVCSSTQAEVEVGLCDEYMNDVQPHTDPTLYVMIKYKERITDPVPVYAPGGNCEEKVCDYSRTQEGYCIEVWDSLPNNYRPPPVTPKPDEVCKDPFPCPDINCCPDPHYILLATISCGTRKDSLFGKLVATSDGSEIRYWVERTLSKVCIIKTNPDADEDIIVVTDKYAFENSDYINDIILKINWSTVGTYLDTQGLKLESQSNGEIDCEGQMGQIILIPDYKIKADDDARSADIKVPITLTYGDNTWKPNEQSVLKSTIRIGTTNVECGSTISEAMIRNLEKSNLEKRKYVPTFPWFAWLLAGNGEGLPWSGDLSVYCAAGGVLQASAPFAMQVTGVREDMRKELDTKIVELENKNANAIKKIETEYKKKLADMDKAIKELTKK